MRCSLSIQIPLILLGVALVTSPLIYMQEEQANRIEITRLAKEDIKYHMSGLQNVLHNLLTQGNRQEALLSLTLAATYPNTRSLMLTNESHRILMANRYSWRDSDASTVSDYDATAAGRAILSASSQLDFNSRNDSLLQGYFPLIIEYKPGGLGKVMGMLYVEYDIAPVLKAAQSRTLKQTLVFAAITLLSALLAALLLHFMVARRLGVLSSTARKLADGDYTARTRLQGNNELSSLGRTLDTMALKVHESIEMQGKLIQRLEKDQLLLSEAQKVGNLGSWELDLASGQLIWSDEIFRIFEIDQSRFGATFEAFLNVIHPDDRELVNHAYTSSLANKSKYEITHRLKMPDGRIKWVIEMCETSYDEQGRPVRSLGTVQDISAQMQDKLALIAAQNDLASTLSAIPDLLFEVDLEGRYYAVHAPRTQLLAVPPELLIGKLISDVLPGDAAAVCMDGLRKANEYGYASGQQFSLTLDEQKKWFELSIARKAQGHEGQARFIILSRDITERKLAELSHLKSEQDLLSLIQNALIGIFHSTPAGSFLMANPALANMLGYATPAELVSTVTDIGSQLYVDQDRRPLILKAALDNPNVWVQVKNQYRRKDGSIMHADLAVRSVPDENGAIAYLEGFVHDTSARELAEAALLEKESQYRKAIETSTDGFLMVDMRGRLTQVNEAYARMSGYSRAELLTMTIPDLEAKERPAETSANIEAIRRDGSARFESEHRRKDGSMFPVQIVTNYSATEGGQIFAFITDLSERHRKDVMLLQQSRMATMGEMIGNIAHQWRQPINALGLILFDLEDSFKHGECDTRYLNNAVTTSNLLIRKMSSTIDDFKNFFKTDNTPASFNMGKIIRESMEIMDATLKHHHISITLDNPGNPVVFGRANDFSQCVINLLANAKDAIGQQKITHGEIAIAISEDEHYGIVTVSDNGGGIPADIITKIFDPYFTTKADGLGIGLYMTHISIEANMGGQIQVENVGKGARFTIRLPKPVTGEEA